MDIYAHLSFNKKKCNDKIRVKVEDLLHINLTGLIFLLQTIDLSSAAFQEAFSLFVARRGISQRVVTDNGRNFLGCSRALELEFSAFVEQAAHDIAQKYITHEFE